MDHNKLKEVIFDWHEFIRSEHFVQRYYDFDPNINYVLIGLRRAGKSTILYSYVQELIESGVEWTQIIYLNFEDERLIGFSFDDFNDILSVQAEMTDKKAYFFFDEIQNVDGWEKFARRMADAKERVFITGSNAKMLSREIATTLGGRYLTKYISPYSFREFLLAKNVPISDDILMTTKGCGKIRRILEEYFVYGGLPESLLLKDKREYLSSVYQKIILGDIAFRNNIRNIHAMKMMIKKIAESVRNEISYNKLRNSLNAIGMTISIDTIIDYAEFAEQAFLIFRIRNGFAKFSDKESIPKYYFSDNGLLNLFLFDKKSALLENIVAVNLRHRYGDDVFYLKSSQTGVDVDFYIPSDKLVIQVAYSIEEIGNERETAAIEKLIKQNFDAERYQIITYAEKKSLEIRGVSVDVTPLLEWLLAMPILEPLQ